ncbi:hypothetical protein DFQ01_12221 [Paenibacillus cellulosilyticus]|uniref:Uncharacterized protein n=1 Tax=Paenibacillus cellulosilyticus TaxID=375489 RepID=A0A2V2YN90_9BACL|nr:hypothetical protein DFQ01_12221 [Paenibacillus cellulosilyticus]
MLPMWFPYGNLYPWTPEGVEEAAGGGWELLRAASRVPLWGTTFVRALQPLRNTNGDNMVPVGHWIVAICSCVYVYKVSAALLPAE